MNLSTLALFRFRVDLDWTYLWQSFNPLPQARDNRYLACGNGLNERDSTFLNLRSSRSTINPKSDKSLDVLPRVYSRGANVNANEELETSGTLIEQAESLQLNGTPVRDTFAEAFSIVGTRLVLTAATEHWARIAADEMCGYATSVIACDVEAGVEGLLQADQTPDGRPGIAVLVFAFSRKALSDAVASRVGQCVLTCPTTACYSGLSAADKENRISIGGQLRFFGDGFQGSKKLGSRRLWRIPVMDGEFVCEDHVGTVKGVAGGNLLICGQSQDAALAAAESAVTAMNAVPGTILPFPGGIVRSGSKVGSRYKQLKASTSDAYCPTLQAVTHSSLPDDCGAVYEIVIDGLSFEDVKHSMQAGLHAASECEGIPLIAAGNYGGKLGPHHFFLRELL